jgi:excisionase family DNA binding protein
MKQLEEKTETLLRVEEVAERLRVPVSWVYRNADELRAYRVGKYLRFSWGRVLEGLDSRGQPHPVAEALGKSNNRRG